MFEEKTLTARDQKELEKKYGSNIEEQIKKIKQGYPVQYLIGNVPFYNCVIEVNEQVLIPRFETEYLVEKILKKMARYKNKKLNVLDLGTGSGCIAITLSKNTQWNCTGIDISLNALKIAQKNNQLNNTHVTFKNLDILKNEIPEFDIYVSNPPYIDSKEKFDATILYEPSIALFAKKDGLEYYEAILKKIPNTPTLVAFEIGETQGKKIKELALKRFPSSQITIEKDLCGKDRYLFIEKNN